MPKRAYLRNPQKKEPETLHEINKAASYSARARNLTHRLYRYPASMSPMITRAIIENFSAKGDLLLDPFCGGGTSAVEALYLGRKIICSDLSPFACFVTKAKALTLSARSVDEFVHWYERELSILEDYRPKNPKPLDVNGQCYSPFTYSTLLKLMRDTEKIQAASLRMLGKVVALNVARRAIDGRARIIPYHQLSAVLKRVGQEILSDIREYLGQDPNHGLFQVGQRSIRVINCDARKLASNLPKYRNKIRLVVTSPPYPGIHVLYHRWQVHGRKETDLPFRLLGFDSEPTASFYTMGARNSKRIFLNYYRNMDEILRSIYELLAPGSVFAQVIAFPKNDGKHVAKYDELMTEAGFVPVPANVEKIQRSVPNRKWYTQIQERRRQTIEHVFLHRKA